MGNNQNETKMETYQEIPQPISAASTPSGNVIGH